MNKIPKVAYFYWGGSVFPYLRYMSIYSFKKYNPDWETKLMVPVKMSSKQSWKTEENKQKLDTKDYMDRLEEICTEIIPFDMESIGFSNDLSEVIKSDISRLYIMYKYGGLWSDSDILFFKPMSIAFGADDNIAYFCYRRGGVSQDDIPVNGPLYHSIGFLMGAKNNQYFQMLFENVGSRLNTDEYQSIGSPYYKEMIDINSPGIYNIGIDVVYPCRSPQIMFKHKATNLLYHITPGTIGWHWYGGHPVCGHYQNLYTEDTYSNYDNIITYILNDINNISNIEDLAKKAIRKKERKKIHTLPQKVIQNSKSKVRVQHRSLNKDPKNIRIPRKKRILKRK